MTVMSNESVYCTSASCDLAMSTRVLAAGWTISRVFKIVAPSFEIVALPEIKTSVHRLNF